ncbi:MAG: MobQ family relaxase, partial [Pseudomonadales bacterium]
MAIYHCSVKIIKRSDGRSATCAIAYRSGERIVDERTGLIHDYSQKPGVDHTEILAPVYAPEWVMDRATLWNNVEQIEKRKDAQLCREVEVSLPIELNPKQQQELVRKFCQSQFVALGMVADIAIHHAKSDNPHAHILLTTRHIGFDGFGHKNRDWNNRAFLCRWREQWQEHSNHSLKQAGHEQRIDHRTLEAQGIDRIPQIHLGPNVIEMEQRGIETERGQVALGIEHTNAQIIELSQYREALDYGRTVQIKASQEYRGAGQRDRAVGVSISLSDGRDTGGLGPAEQSLPGESRSSGSVESSSTTSQSPQAELEDLLADARRQHCDSGGAVDRIVALARTEDTDSSGDNLVLSQAQQPIDRCYLAVRRQLNAMGCERYEVGIRDSDGRMMPRKWTESEVLKSVGWLKRENAKGSDIYIRPAGSQGIVLVDDLTRGSLTAMREQGFTPALVTETSPQNYQAWIRLSDSPLEPHVATCASKTLAKQYNADPSSADWGHYGRLAGFTNRKPAHITDTGRNPWVLCHESSGRKAPRGEDLVKVASQPAQGHERESRLKASESLCKGVSGGDPVEVYQKEINRLTARYGPSTDFSRADFMVCQHMIKLGFNEQQLVETLKKASPKLATRKAGHQNDYCERTVRKAIQSIERDKAQL